MFLTSSLWKVRYRTSHVWAWLGTSFFCTLQPPRSLKLVNRCLVIAEVFNVSCNAGETRALIFQNARGYQHSNIFRLSIVQALALKYPFRCVDHEELDWLPLFYSAYSLFLSLRGDPTKNQAYQHLIFFLEDWTDSVNFKVGINSLYFWWEHVGKQNNLFFYTL